MSEIITFFEGKTIFLTGATGFIGKLLIEQLLRKCEPKRIYLLIRCKKNMDSQLRKQQLFNEVLFDELRKSKPNVETEIVDVVSGDLGAENLGITEEKRRELCENIEIVIHGGAVVKFDEHLRLATKINVEGTISVIKLCHQIKKLQSFMHISTAFSNCPYLEIKEEFYDTHITCDELINIIEKLSDDELNVSCKKILDKWPNTYTFTKALAENAIKTYAKDLPVTIFRPSIITGTLSEPLPGWIDNKYGPVSFVIGGALGILRTAKINPKVIAEIVPADKVACCILAAIYKRSLLWSSNKIPVYNFVTNNQNKITWGYFNDMTTKWVIMMPPSQMLWPINFSLQTNVLFYEMYSIYFHLLPAVVMDISQRLQNKTPRALKMYIKVRKFIDLLEYFGKQTWTFSDNNTKELWNDLNNEDKTQFNFNLDFIDWPNYLKVCYEGIRFHILKESPDSVELALKKFRRCKIVEKIVQMSFYGFVAYMGYQILAVTSV